MALAGTFDVVISGSGIAGAVLAGTLARAGVNVLLAEKESQFRDRIRGEGIYHWGRLEARKLGVEQLFSQADGVNLNALAGYEDQKLAHRFPWAPDGGEDLYGIAFTHPRFQEIAWAWAEAQGATMRRATKVVDFAPHAGATVTVVDDGVATVVRSRLLVGADGKLSKARMWTGGTSQSDPESHRFGGVAISGLATDDRDTDNFAGTTGCWVNWFAQGSETTRIYLSMGADRLHQMGVHQSFDALVQFAGRHMPQGAVDDVTQAGPIGFFPNSDTWATRVSGDCVTLVGDAAGSVDPSRGHGTSLAMRDVRELSDLLLADDDWSAAIREYEDHRPAYYDVIHEVDRWYATLAFDASPEGDRLRAGNGRAEAADPTLGGFGVLAARGPDGLVADGAAKAQFFGENLSD